MVIVDGEESGVLCTYVIMFCICSCRSNFVRVHNFCKERAHEVKQMGFVPNDGTYLKYMCIMFPNNEMGD